MIFTSFFTAHGSYPTLAANLISSLDRFGLQHDIRAVTTNLPWIEVTRQKPAFLTRQLFEHRQPVVWIDVDAEIRQMPDELLRSDADFGVLNWNEIPGAGTYDPGKMTCSGGVYLLGYTAPALRLLSVWADFCKISDATEDQTLDCVYNQRKDIREELRYFWFPERLNAMTQRVPDTVVAHYYVEGKWREPGIRPLMLAPYEALRPHMTLVGR